MIYFSPENNNVSGQKFISRYAKKLVFSRLAISKFFCAIRLSTPCEKTSKDVFEESKTQKTLQAERKRSERTRSSPKFPSTLCLHEIIRASGFSNDVFRHSSSDVSPGSTTERQQIWQDSWYKGKWGIFISSTYFLSSVWERTERHWSRKHIMINMYKRNNDTRS